MRKVSRSIRRLTAYSTALLIAAAGATAEPFAPGVISTPQHGCITFAPDGKTVIFVQRTPSPNSPQHAPSPQRLMISHFDGKTWSIPQTLPFSGPDSGRVFDGDPAMSPDGSRLFFMSKKTGTAERKKIWSVTRQGETWSEPKPVADGDCGPSVAADGTLYFCYNGSDTRGSADIYRSRLVNGKYSPPENLGDAINTASAEFDTFVAPDQSYLIFTRRISPDKSEFYLAEQTSSGWTVPRAIALPGTPGFSYCPVVSPDGKSFLYTGGPSGSESIHRLDTATLQPPARSWSGPQHFAPGVISSESAGGITFTPDGNTAYFSKKGTIVVSHLKNGQWSVPETAPFSGKYPEGDPSVSPDGSRLYYYSLRPATGKPTDGMYPDLWYVERQGDGWSEPKSVGGGPNGEWSPFSLRTGTPSQAADGTLYFFRCAHDPCRETRIVRSKPKNGRYIDYEDLGDTVNGKGGGFDLAVAPDQSFIVFCAKRPDSLGDYDIYISYQKDGVWSEPRNLGPKVNSMGGEISPKLSPDGKRLFFTHNGIRFVEMADILGT